MTAQWGMVPAWILDPDLYLPAAPSDELKPGDEKPLGMGELRVYIAMRTFADETGYCKLFVRTIAERAKVSRATAEKAIAKFRRLGWLTIKRLYRPDGSIQRCDYFLRNECPGAEEGVPSRMRGGSLHPGGEGSLPLEGAKNTPDEHTNRTDHGSEQSSTASGGGANETEDQVEFVEITDKAPGSSATKKLSQARANDRELFHGLVGEKIHSDGSKFTEGTFDWDKFYDAFRKWKRRKAITWPGKMLERIAEDAPDGTADDWLMYLGLETA